MSMPAERPITDRLTGTGSALELRGVTRLFGALAALVDVTLTSPRDRSAEVS